MKACQTFFGSAFALAGLLTQALAAPSTEPVNPNASESARSLLAYLVNVTSTGDSLSGQQELEDVEWVTENFGETPAILGVDFMDYSPSRVEFGASSTAVEDALSFSEQGGIITFCWHWGSPSGTLNTTEQPWYSNFYTEATSFDLAAAMSENSTDYELILRDIDAIAKQLKRLQDADIPVLFRPLHEADGGWFWWGAKGAEPCKELYELLFDRLTNEHGLNNLVWVWNSVEPNWYPGNDIVDIVSVDVYADEGDHSPQSESYEQLKSLSDDSKLIALGEVGNIPDPEQMRNESISWAYWVTWNGEFIRDEKNNPSDFKEKVFNSEYVLTLEEIGGVPERR